MRSINMMAETTDRVEGMFNFLPIVWVRINVFQHMIRVTIPVCGHVEKERAPVSWSGARRA